MFNGILAVTVSVAFLMTACGASSMAADKAVAATTSMAMSSPVVANGAYYDYDAIEEEVALEESSATSSDIDTAEIAVERKIIKNADLTMETMEYDSAYAVISEITGEVGGYIESSSIDGISLYDQQRGYQSDRYAHFTIRVPADQLNVYIDALSGKFNITNKSESANDISDQYYDAQARLENLEIQEDRLLELLQQAGALADLLEIEKELADVRYEIETITASLKRMDSKVSYSTVNISLYEVFEYQEKTVAPRTFADRIMGALEGSADNFLDFCEDLLIAIIYAAPMLLFFAVIVLIVIFIIRAIHKRRVKKLPTDSGWQAPKRVENEGSEEKKGE